MSGRRRIALWFLGTAVLAALAISIRIPRGGYESAVSIETEQLRPPMIYEVAPIALAPVDGVRWSQQPLAPVEGVRWALSTRRGPEGADGSR
jgi:hypothetical protein